MQEKHEAQLQVAIWEKGLIHSQNDHMQLVVGDCLVQLKNFHQKLSTITESLTVVFAMLQFLATTVPLREAKTAVRENSFWPLLENSSPSIMNSNSFSSHAICPPIPQTPCNGIVELSV